MRYVLPRKETTQSSDPSAPEGERARAGWKYLPKYSVQVNMEGARIYDQNYGERATESIRGTKKKVKLRLERRADAR